MNLANSQSASDGSICVYPPAIGVENCRKFSNEIFQQQFLGMNTKQFCTQTAKIRSLMHDLHWATGGTKGIAEFESQFNRPNWNLYKDRHNGWYGALYPHPKMRQRTFDGLIGDIPGGADLKDPQKLTTFLSTPGQMLDRFPNSHGALEQAKRAAPMQQAQQSQALMQKAYVCKNYGLANISACMKAVDRVLQIMAPTENFTSFIPVIEEVLTDSRYVEASRKAALKVWTKIQNNTVPQGDLLSDIRASFLEAGLSVAKAEEMAWKLLLVTQLHGAESGNSLAQFATKATSPLVVAVTVIAAGEYLLDGRRSGTGTLYSYPANVKIDCDFGKAYDFWVAAYLARVVTKELGNADAASAAAWIGHLGYQMRASTADRDPTRPFTEDVFGVTNNGIRMDLAVASAGAVYGSQVAMGQSKKLNVDLALKELLKGPDLEFVPLVAREASNLWTGTGLEGYRRWINLFDPNRAYEFYHGKK